ncbi:MAG: peptidase, partial [Lachnospiraceae bacterium]|nr:peptidase [Lachnospiraceae bacterium]
MEAFYYNQMSKVEQAVYHAMKTGFSEMATSFLVPRVEAKVLGEVFFRMRLDHPEIFYAVNFKYRSYRDSNNLEIIPEYLFEKSKVKDHQKAMKSRVEKLVRPAAKMSEKEKEQYIHDFICQNVHYDKLKKAYSHEIIGPLGQGVGV